MQDWDCISQIDYTYKRMCHILHVQVIVDIVYSVPDKQNYQTKPMHRDPQALAIILFPMDHPTCAELTVLKVILNRNPSTWWWRSTLASLVLQSNYLLEILVKDQLKMLQWDSATHQQHISNIEITKRSCRVQTWRAGSSGADTQRKSDPDGSRVSKMWRSSSVINQ